MSAAAQTSNATTEPSRSGRILDLVRKLIEYGRELAATIRQRAVTDPRAIRCCFGTTDIALILARITRGLERANELEARVLQRAAYLDAGPRPARARSERAPAATRPTRQAEPPLPSLPTPAQIAAEVRRRPIAAVIADICRDLGIIPSHPLWTELRHIIIEHGGNYAALVKDCLDRAFPLPPLHSLVGAQAPLRAPPLQNQAACSTGPPNLAPIQS